MQSKLHKKLIKRSRQLNKEQAGDLMQTTGDQLIHTLSRARRLDGREECCAEGSDRDTHTHIHVNGRRVDYWDRRPLRQNKEGPSLPYGSVQRH